MSWYALFVETGREMLIQKWIKYFFEPSVCHSLIPKRRLIERRQGKNYEVVKVLFPGYVFINTDMCIEYYYKLADIPGLLRILNNGSYYSKIDESEMHPILKLIGNGDTIDYSKVFIKNSRIYVKSGPLYGSEGIIESIDKHHKRAHIMLDFIDSPKIINVGIELLEIIS